MKKRKSLLRRVASRARGDSVTDVAKEPVPVVTIQDNKTPDSSLSHRTPTPELQNVALQEQDHSMNLSVTDACEDIWKCQDPDQAASWLQIVHHSLLRTPMESYSPSEVFLCISGAAHRFHESGSVWEEAIWASAALARVCVGPAWRNQLRERREWMQQHGDSDSIQTDLSQHQDVMTMDNSTASRSSVPDVASREPKKYPAIPENIPPAMLRFAATDAAISSPDTAERSKSLAEAQRELVLALCCLLPEEETEDSDRLEWAIVGAHAPIATMMRFWLESLATSLPKPKRDDRESTTQKMQTMIPPQKESVKTKSYEGGSKIVHSHSDNESHSQAGMASLYSGGELSSTEERTEASRDASIPDIEHPTAYIWNSGLDSRQIDWWSAIEVVRACFHLVSAGWRVPQNEQGEEVIAYLLEVTERGMLTRAGHQSKNDTEAESNAREERLTASSTAAVAVTVLSAIASTGLVPRSMHSIVVRVLCRLQVAMMSDDSVATLFPEPSSASDDEAWKSDWATFLAQREECRSDVRALQWILLAHKSSAATSMATLLGALCSNANTDMPLHTRRDVIETTASFSGMIDTCAFDPATTLATACVSLEAISGALWGMPPDLPGIASLRIYWYDTLRVLRKLAGSLHDGIVRIDEISRNKNGDADAGRELTVNDAFSLVVVIIGSLASFMEAELLQGEGLLSLDEWEEVFIILDENIDKWLCSSHGPSLLTAPPDIRQRVKHEANLLLDRLRDFLENHSHLESSPFNLMVDDESQIKLFTVLLRKAVPYMSPESGTALAYAVIHSWSAIGFSLRRSDNWARTAAFIITDAFSVFEDLDFGYYKGYTHSPSVRLEALKSIALGEGQEGTTLHTEFLGEMVPRLSPLEMTLHMREQHLALINGSIVYPLMTMFGMQPSDSNSHVAVVIPLPVKSFSSVREQVNLGFYESWAADSRSQSFLEESELELRRFALVLLGRLFRSIAGEKWHRACFLEMMRSVAIKDAMDVIQSSRKASKDAPASKMLDEPFPSAFHTSLVAIGELEKCLCLSFRVLPHAHESLPLVVDMLCSILVVYGGEVVKEKNWNDGIWLTMKRCLAMAALLPLARLRGTHEQKLVLGRELNLTSLLPPSIASLLGQTAAGSGIQVRTENSQQSMVAPFVVISGGLLRTQQARTSRAPKPSTGKTQLSFGPIFAGLVAVLRTNMESRRSRNQADIDPKTEALDSAFRTRCYDVLGRIIRSGIAFPLSKEFISMLSCNCSTATSPHENLSRIRCVAAVAEALVSKQHEQSEVIEATDVEDDASNSSFLDVEQLIEHILLSCLSRDSESVLYGCQAISGLTVFIVENMSTCGLGIFESVLQRLKLEIHAGADEPMGGIHANVRTIVVGESLISVLYDIVCALPRNCVILPLEEVSRTIVLCVEVGASRLSRLSRTCRILAVQLAAALLDMLILFDAEKSKTALSAIESRFLELASAKVVENEGACHDFVPNNEIYMQVLGDLIAEKLHGHGGVIEATDGLKLTYHEYLARETDDINRFVVESNKMGGEEPVAAWSCGQTILTCRVGALKSRYRGWVEIVLRSPTSRIRRMVRLPSVVSLDCPELPTTLWSNPATVAGVINTTETGNEELLSRFNEPSSAMMKALSLIEKYDDMFGRPNLDTKSGERISNEDVPAAFVTEHVSSDVQMKSAADMSNYRPPREPQSGSKADEEDAVINTVQEWLHAVLRDQEREQCILDELVALGFSPEMLEGSESSPQLSGLGGRYLPLERLSFGPNTRRGISILDRRASLNTHKIALIFATYAAPDEAPNFSNSLESTALSGSSGSPQFLKFAEGLGKLVLTRHLKYFSGGLDSSGFDSDGKFALIFLDNCDRPARNMVVFHSVPLMPEGANNRKKHVGNDNVHIVFVDPSFELDRLLHGHEEFGKQESITVSGEFGFVIIFVVPLSAELTEVRVCLRDGLCENSKSRLSHFVGEHLLSSSAAPGFVRQIAIRADIVCRSITEEQFGPPNWEERQRQISAMKRYVQ